MLMRLCTPPLTPPLLLKINVNLLHPGLRQLLPRPVLLLAGGADAGVRWVWLEGVVELGDVGQDGQTVGAASGHVGHVQQGGDAQPSLGSEKRELAVPEKTVENFYYGRRQCGSSVQQTSHFWQIEWTSHVVSSNSARKEMSSQPKLICCKLKVRPNFDMKYLNGCQILQTLF